jgi:hypothetical protein
MEKMNAMKGRGKAKAKKKEKAKEMEDIGPILRA